MSRPAAVSVDDSYNQCVALTRRHAKNFHYAFMVLPRERYRGICSLYAVTRIADDISDDEKDPKKALENSAAWRKSFERALAGDGSDHPVLPAVAETMKRFEIPPQYMHDLITGTETATGHVKVFDGQSGGLLASFLPFGSFTGVSNS